MFFNDFSKMLFISLIKLYLFNSYEIFIINFDQIKFYNTSTSFVILINFIFNQFFLEILSK